MTVRVLIVDDEELVRTGLRLILEAEPDLTVVVRSAGDALDVEVRDDGRGQNGQRAIGGHGLVGMRERAALYGGCVEAGNLPDGAGFRVRARLLVDGSPR